MNKEKYLKEIEKRLDRLSPQQKQTEVFRISNDLDNGKVMNDISVEVENIYKKYKIKKNAKKRNLENERFPHLVSFADSIKENDYKQNIVVVRDIIIMILIVSFLKIPFIALYEFVFGIFQNMIADKYYVILNVMINVIYIIFAVYLFIVLFKRRFKKEMNLD